MPISGGTGGSFSGTPNDNTVSTAKVVDDAVTLDKIQEISTAKILGRVSSGSGNPEQLTGADVRTIAELAEVTDGNQVGIEIQDSAPVDGTKVVVTYAPFPFTIDAAKNRQTSAGTLTFAIKINGTSVTGLSAVATTSTPGNSTASAANSVAKGDEIEITYSSVSGAANFRTTITGTR